VITGEPSVKASAGAEAFDGQNVSGRSQPLDWVPAAELKNCRTELQEPRVAGAAVGFGFFGFFVSFL
jgi:hypothetical protein